MSSTSATPGPEDRVSCRSAHDPFATGPYPVRFGSPAELAAATRHEYLARTGPLPVASRAGYHPDGPWPGSALESAQNVLATRPGVLVQLDLRRTVDGTCVVLHEPVMGRACTGVGPISEQSADYVLSQRLVDNHGEVSGYRVREAADFLAWAVREGAVLWLVAHDVDPAEVVRLVRAHDAAAHVVVAVHGRAELTAYRELAPELVYCVPTGRDGLGTAEDVRREAPDPARLIGWGGQYMPDPEEGLRLRSWDVPTVLDLTRYDENLHDDELDPHCYRRAVETGCLILVTTHYREAADLLGVRPWQAAPTGRRAQRG